LKQEILKPSDMKQQAGGNGKSINKKCIHFISNKNKNGTL